MSPPYSTIEEHACDTIGRRIIDILMAYDCICCYMFIEFYLLCPDYYDLGDTMIECRHCKTLMWYQERMDKHKHAENPKYKLCCGNGKVELPFLKYPPSLLSHFLFDQDSKDSKNFQS